MSEDADDAGRSPSRGDEAVRTPAGSQKPSRALGTEVTSASRTQTGGHTDGCGSSDLREPGPQAQAGELDSVHLLPLVEIVQHQAVWPRGTFDETALARYRECPDQLPPVRVDRQTRVLLDGYHRVKVHQDLGRPEIPAIFEDCPPHEQLARSLELNLHGTPIPITQRNRVLAQLSEQGFTQTEIAKVAGLTQERVSQILAAYRGDKLEARPEPEDQLWVALRLVDQGRSIRDAARVTRIPKSTVERAVLQAKTRERSIRQHLQTRAGLTSLLRYPNRGPWGQSRYFGNCTGYLLVDLLDYFKPQSVFDPMEGSGTTREVCFDLNLTYEGRDLRAGFDLLSSPLPDRVFDLIFWHPPYWPGHQYTAHPNDFSNAKNEADFLHRMKEGFERLADLLTPKGHLVLLIGDGRKNGVFYPVHSVIIQWGLLSLEAVLIKEGDHERRARHFQYGPTSFIPTLHEYVLIFRGHSA